MANPRIQLACDIIQDEFEHTVKVRKSGRSKYSHQVLKLIIRVFLGCMCGIDGAK